MKKEISIDCFDGGTVKIEGIGFVGKECNTEMAVFEKAMGKTIERKNKSDIHKQKRVSTQRS